MPLQSVRKEDHGVDNLRPLKALSSGAKMANIFERLGHGLGPISCRVFEIKCSRRVSMKAKTQPMAMREHNLQ